MHIAKRNQGGTPGIRSQSYGLGAAMCMSAGGAVLVFVVALCLKETHLARAARPVLQQAAAD